tara:strand:- start:3071 stop:3283 length:213 start_codon:yes stop_codon:yes gene_type:complete
MRIRTALTAVAAAAVAATPLAAVQARTSMPVEGESEIGGGVSALAGVAIFAAIVAAVYFVADSEDEAVSP